MDRLRDLLRAARPGWFDDAERRRLLALPTCRPRVDDPDVGRCDARVAPPPSLPVGRAAGVGVRGEAAQLWLLSADVDGHALDLVDHAGEAADLAWTAAVAAAPLLGTRRILDRPRRPRARPVVVEGRGAPVALDGGSFGLPLALVAISELTGVPVPDTVLGTAAVHADGTLDTVRGLRAKLSLVGRWALGVRTVLVHPDQAEKARVLLAQADPERTIEVHGCTTLAEAVGRAFPDLRTRLREALGDPDERSALAEVLFQLTVRRRRHLACWDAVERTAVLLADLDLDARDRWKIQAVHAIAARHEMRPGPAMPSLSELPGDVADPVRLDLFAHTLQALADRGGAEEEALRTAREAEAIADAVGGFEAAHVVRGAIARLHGAWGRYGEAFRHAQRALEGWQATGAPHEGSRPLCEALRVLPFVAGDVPAALAELERGWVSWVEPSLTEHPFHACHLRLARARARLAAGDAPAALHLLGDVPFWGAASVSLAASRHRWRLATGLGSPAEREAWWRGLVELADDEEGRYALCLAALDDAVAERGESPERLDAALAAFCALDAGRVDVERILAFTGSASASPVERARILVRHARY